MQRNEIATAIVTHLSDKDKLSFRRASKGAQKFIKDNIAAPYRTKAQFVCALTGIYRFNKHNALKSASANGPTFVVSKSDVTQLIMALNGFADYLRQQSTENILMTCAWNEYKKTIDSGSMLPAILYKLREKVAITHSATFRDFAAGEDLKDKGRQYAPQNTHAWDANQAWLLAQIHKGRRFALFSPPSNNNVYRIINHQKHKDDYSAFAREIAAVMKAGYTLFLKPYVEFRPNPCADLLRVTFDDLTVSDAEVSKAVTDLRKFISPQSSN